ncbi:MAG: VWA domain-containing protein [Firmicutes bacterium]|nr:VWA domain-containing protein [Bacillota bacterium]
MAINFLRPWYLLLLLPTMLLFVVVRGRTRYPAKLNRWVLLLRLLLFLLVVLALARPHVVKTYHGLRVVFLADRSVSVESAPDYTTWINESLSYQNSDDQAAVLVFAQDNQLVKPFTMDKLAGVMSADINRDHTDIESALRMAAGLIPADSNGRIVLLTDGVETTGDSISFAKALGASQIPIDVLPLSVVSGEDVAIVDVSLPRNTYPGQQVTVEVEVESSIHTRAKLSLYWGGGLVFKDEISLTAGQQRFSLPVEVTGESMVKVQAEVDAEQDTQGRNNTMAGITFVDAPPRVLMVEGAPGKGQYLHDLFVLGGVEAHSVTPSQLSTSPSALAGYRAIYLVDVPAYVLSVEQQQNLEIFVRVVGGGLVAVGGKNSFGLGLYQDTPLEKLLPVAMEVENEEELPGLDLVLVIDRSGSMTGDKLNMAKNAAIVSLDILKERDRLGVITFDDTYYVNLPLTEVANKSELTGIIEKIAIGGGTVIHPALEEAVQQLSEGERAKQIILLSDGMEGATVNYGALLAQMSDLGISLSTIALGSDADTSHMQMLAENSNGRFYLVPHSADLPAVFLQETVLAGGDYLVEEEFMPTIVHPDANTLHNNTPRFTGYVASTAKPLSEILLLTHREHPLLARWQYGLGRTIAFTSDARGLWSEEFIKHPRFADFWADTLAWVAPRGGEGGMALDVGLQGDSAEITALVGEPLQDGEKLLVTVADEDFQQQELELLPSGSGRYRATLEQINQGVYIFNTRRQRDEVVSEQVVSGFAVPYSAEFRIPSGSGGNDLLSVLSEGTGGLTLTRPQDVFRAPLEPARRFVALGHWFLLAAVLLWPLDVALRRFGTVPSIPIHFRQKASTPVVTENNTAREAMEQLLAAKKKKK